MPINADLAQTQITANVSGTEQVQALAGAMNNVGTAEENVSKKGAAYLLSLIHI